MENHTLYQPKFERPSTKIMTPPLLPYGKYLDTHTLVGTLEDAGWHVTITILTIDIWGGIHTNNIISLFEQCYISELNAHPFMYVTNSLNNHQNLNLLMLNKCKLENHQQVVIFT